MKKITIAFSLFIFSACAKPDVKPLTTGKEGQAMPSFNVRMMDSVNYFNTTSISNGKPSILFYFSPTCPYCRMETRRIITNINELKNVQFVFLTDGDEKKTKEYIKEFNIDKYSNIKIGTDTGYVFAKYFRPGAVPFTAIYDSEGRLSQAFIGAVKSRQIMAATKI